MLAGVETSNTPAASKPKHNHDTDRYGDPADKSTDFIKLTAVMYHDNLPHFEDTFFNSNAPALSTLLLFQESKSQVDLPSLPHTLQTLVFQQNVFSASEFRHCLGDSKWLPELESLEIVFDDEGRPPHPDAPSQSQGTTAIIGERALSERVQLEAAAMRRGVELKLVREWKKKWVLVDVDDERFDGEVEREKDSEGWEDSGFVERLAAAFRSDFLARHRQ